MNAVARALPRLALREATAVAVVLAPWSWFVVRDLVPIFDGAAVVLPLLLGGLLGAAIIGALATRTAEAALVVGSWLLFSLVAIAGPWLPQSSPPPAETVRVATANLGEVIEPFTAIEDVLAQEPDVVVVPEDKYALDLLLASHYDYSHLFHRSTRVGFYSKYPFETGEIPDERLRNHGFRAQVEGPSGTFVVYALHLPRPWFRDEGARYVSLGGQRELSEALAASASGEPYPVVIAGDLNLTDRASGYRTLANNLRDAVLTGGGGPTSTQFRWRPLLLRIDHIFVSHNWCAANGARFDAGSADHRGVRADLGPCA